MQFYSVILKKKVEIPDQNIRMTVVRGRKAAVGTYLVDGKQRQAFRFMPN